MFRFIIPSPSQGGRVRALLLSVVGLLAVGIMVPILASPSIADDFPDLTEALEAKEFVKLYNLLRNTPNENSGLDGPMGWLLANVDETDFTFAALLMEKVFPHDPSEALRWFYVAFAWHFQDAAECTDGTTMETAIFEVLRMRRVVDKYARENPEEDVRAFEWGLEWVAETPSPSDADVLCMSGDEFFLAWEQQGTNLDFKKFLKPAEERQERREKVLVDLREILEARRWKLTNEKPPE